ncbi:phage repressor protein CI [Leclercia adecarboxylata]|uniref:phage repressor protein CI n=1 Tax=Leclercia adecarboxylata TaxID=83655 RepID=UPI0027BBABFB|nr:phage repressor protein CI [Leclercia adecarboxylata]MDQ2129550.1 phage repressor protein CI [Leclercia adecarboxylata]MDV7059410.1 phage repressor protein CI [Leclercia adecarboxylata]
MANFKIDLSMDSTPVLDRVIEAYGFSSKLMLAQHLDMAASSLSSRYKRGGFPADIAVRCIAETGVNLEWLATGKGRKFNEEDLDILRIPRKKIVDGQLYEAGILQLDKVLFVADKPIPTNPLCVLDGLSSFIIERQYSEIFDGEWLVEIEGKCSVRTLNRIPIRKIRVSGVGMAFDCGLDDINIIGRVALTIN